MNQIFQNIDGTILLVGLTVLLSLIFMNEVVRRNKYAALFFFLVIPIIFSIFVWPNTAVKGSSVGTWFDWAKLYSVLTISLIMMAISHVKKLSTKKFMLMLPAILLAVNIMEAVIRDFQVYSMHGFHDGMVLNGGPWNIMNGIAGILNILAISGWLGIFASKSKGKDMVWPDQIWVWVIAYDFWNFAYTYNCIPNHSWYAGLILLLSSLIPFILIKRGVWLQHRAFTLAFWMMFAMSYPSFIDNSEYAVKSSNNETSLLVFSSLALLANILLISYHIYRIRKYKLNPLKDEIYSDTEAYKIVIKVNK